VVVSLRTDLRAVLLDGTPYRIAIPPGATARAFAQEMPHGIDSAIAMSTPGSGQVSLLNQALDATFAAKALLAPDNDTLVLVGLPADRAYLEAEWSAIGS
jgi:hypothetical protein